MIRRRAARPQVEAAEFRRHKPDYIFGILALLIAVIGLVVMFSVSPAIAALKDEPSSFYFSRHATFFLIGLAAFILFATLKMAQLKLLVLPLAAGAAGVSLLVLATGGVGARWLQLGGLSFQPAELIKFSIVIWLAHFLSQRIESQSIAVFSETLRTVLVVTGAAAFLMVVLQRDLGSTAVLFAVVGTMLFIAKVPIRPLLIGAAVVVLLGALSIASTPYRRDRFMTFLNPERDCQVEGYHACQALIAVGSGGLGGLGIQNSVQAYGYLPESATDSIFAIYAEKFGFIGSVLLIALYGALLSRMVIIMQRAPHYRHQLMVAGVIAWVGFQGTINIGAMLGILPLKGITLPLISYGGTSLIFVLAALGVVFQISRYTLTRRTLAFRDNTLGDERRTPVTPRVVRSY